MATTLKINKFERRVGVGLAGTYGNLGTINRYVPVEEATLDYVKDSVVKEELGVTTSNQQAYKREAVLTPSLTIPVEADSIGELLYALCGTVDTSENETGTGGTQNKHVFTLSGTVTDDLPCAILKDDRGQGTAYDYVGIRGNNVTFAVNSKETLKMTYDSIGQQEIAGTSAPTTVDYGTFAPFTFKDLTVTVDGTAETGIYNIEIPINRNLGEGFRVGTQEYTTHPLPGKSIIEPKFAIEYQDADRTARYLSGGEVGIEVTFTGESIVAGGTGKNELKFRMPKVNYMTAPLEYADDDLLSVAVGGYALEKGTSNAGTSYALQIELYNTVGTYELG